ncbi:hypothetical protein [Paenibacillus mucilaginosus]|uniref:Uncharacterized protein n=3 Tax=Paenibacillus mucilaginosus TaxID=61624 RepID=H6NJX2_9BACL|nr:hypothetical protein [Paenibacillus mucilaginosus]AEI41770.1 hypothetical protein KNP414_03212 [Paenibacillus mucilaginosus KNP414]AFC30276.1 hypothetical protein PM3016_3437 [Paenibacillus mucilaginosus 3016]AFH62546.1 hypothetical protein B2K_17760 [Paenibacillus mucilaginosus K02]MCG7214457.1 hypothetical protein [Paenibacillus mucilaginosus]WDM30740.1 hypothetical protein KCX80_16965 [Paenibacillus mucilaginosus]
MATAEEKRKQEEFVEAYLRERRGLLPANEGQAETAAVQAFQRLNHWVHEARKRREASDS